MFRQLKCAEKKLLGIFCKTVKNLIRMKEMMGSRNGDMVYNIRFAHVDARKVLVVTCVKWSKEVVDILKRFM